MKKQHLILLTAGIVLAVIVIAAKKKIISEPIDIIKPGDKGNEVFGLQYAISAMTGVKFGNMGVYDNETLSAVQYYMNGTNALADYTNGYVKKSFASDLYLMQNKTKKG
jgi:hypothetical protein